MMTGEFNFEDNFLPSEDEDSQSVRDHTHITSARLLGFKNAPCPLRY